MIHDVSVKIAKLNTKIYCSHSGGARENVLGGG